MRWRPVAIVAAIVVLAVAYMVNDARRTARLGACIQRGIDWHEAAGTYPALADGSPANPAIARACDDDPDAFAEPRP